MKKALFFILVCALGFTAFGQTISLRSADKAECVKSDMNGLTAMFSFSSLEATTVETSCGEFSEIHIEGSYPNGNVGEPQLPMFTKLIVIPTGATPIVTVGAHSETDYTLSNYRIGTVSAMQAPIRKDVEPSTVEYAFNEAAYSRNSFNDDPVAMVEMLGTMRGLTIGRLIVQPVRYNPVAGTVKVFYWEMLTKYTTLQEAWEYKNAAMVCAYCSDRLWLQGEACDFPVLPLLYRFLSMHRQCVKLSLKDEFLRNRYKDSELEGHYLLFTLDDQNLEREFSECYESMKAWRFGKVG